MADIQKLVAEMTLEEKAALVGGQDFWHTNPVERLGIPAVMVSDGPHGLRKQDDKADHLGINESIRAVCFPAACATAASFDTDMIGRLGETIGNECQAEDVSVVLGPAVNMKRSPLCGRNFEYFSEDPYLAGKMAAAYINGVQRKNVGTSIKHFAVNNQEFNRMSTSAEVSERALREIYFPAFEIAVKEAQPKTVMCSYNKINGTYASDHEWLLTKVLREDWGFEGYVMTDWGAVDDRIQGIRAGLDLEMPGPSEANARLIVEAVKDGSLDAAKLDQSVERILTVMYSYLENRDEAAVFDRDADHAVAAQMETECAVLLQNDGILPLSKEQNIVYIGEFAEHPRFQGGGSSHINASKVTSAKAVAEEKGRHVSYVRGFSGKEDLIEEKEVKKAVEAAKNADVAVIFAGLPDSFESEGYDRGHMLLPDCQLHLIEEVVKVQPKIVIVLHNGSPVEAPFAEDVPAILEMYLGGQGVGEATDALLYGEANPSGHLAETFPYHLEDTPSYLNFPGDGKTVHYAEDVFVGYRYYDTKLMPVRWAFGHGLSYTTFDMTNIRVDADQLTDEGVVQVSVDVTNTGDRAGKEVVQLYVSPLDAQGSAPAKQAVAKVMRPVKELKGFDKIALEPGETKTVTLPVDARALSYYAESLGDWYTPSGKYQILIGDSSDHILQTIEISFTTKKVLPLVVDRTTTVGELLQNPRTASFMKKFMATHKGFIGADDKQEGGDASKEAISDDMTQAMLAGLPIKSMVSFGIIERDKMQELIDQLNTL